MAQKRHPGFAIWFTGLPASGKTTLARALQRQLEAEGIRVQLLDSDELRRRLTPHPTYRAEERDWFYETIVFLAELLTRNGVNVLIAATAPARRYRDAARARLARFAEVLVACPPDVCRARDPKGLWGRADRGDISAFPGVGVAYEPPSSPELRVNTAHLTVEEATRRILVTLGEREFFSWQSEDGAEGDKCQPIDVSGATSTA